MPALASKAFANIFDENGARIYFNGKVETAKRQKRKGAILRGTELREVRIRGKDIYTGLMPLTLRGADGNSQNKMLGFESLTEGDFWSVVNFSEEQLTTAYAQPAKLPIFMFGRRRHWIPDGLLEFQNGKRRLVEVKPLEVVAIDPKRDPERSRWVAEWYGAIKQAAEISGFEFELYTDKEIRSEPRFYNSKMMARALGAQIPKDAVHGAILALDGLPEDASVETLATRLGGYRRSALLIACLLDHGGIIQIDRTRPFRRKSAFTVCKSPARPSSWRLS